MTAQEPATRMTTSKAGAVASLDEIERQRRHLWVTAFIALVVVSLVVVVMSYWTDVLPDTVQDALGVPGWRFVFLLVSAGFIAYAIERERTFRALTRRLVEERARAAALEVKLEEVSAMADVAKILAESLDHEDLTQVVTIGACRLVDAARGALLVLEGNQSGEPMLRVEASVGFEGAAPERVALDGDMFGRTFETGVPQRAPGGLFGSDDRSSVAVPLTARGELLGLLAVSSDLDLDEYHERMLTLFSEQAALALANARAYQEERRSAARLAEMDRKRADFVASITHELKTPLTSLLGYATILRKRSRTLSHEQRDEFVAVMEKQGQRILRLIEEMLQSSRLEAGLGKLQRRPLNLVMIVTELAREISIGRGRAIEVDAPQEDLELFGDPAAIEHVVTNLIDNALKYSDDDSTVRISVMDDEGEVLLRIADEGVGIDPNELPFIFDRFQQSSNARGRASVGLGLYIVRNLVTAHSGRVWAESELGKGTTFTVALPRRRDR